MNLLLYAYGFHNRRRLRQVASKLGLDKMAKLLKEKLREEKEANTAVAEGHINYQTTEEKE